MQVAEKDKGMEIPIWDEYKKIVAKYDARGEAAFGSYERFEFYDEARKTYCILQSGETAIYANLPAGARRARRARIHRRCKRRYFQSGFSIFLSFFKPHRGLFFLDMACALVVSMIDLAYPIISRYAMRTLLPSKTIRSRMRVFCIVTPSRLASVTFWPVRSEPRVTLPTAIRPT